MVSEVSDRLFDHSRNLTIRDNDVLIIFILGMKDDAVFLDLFLLADRLTTSGWFERNRR